MDIIERVSKNDKLPPQAVRGMLKGLEKARIGRVKAREAAAEAKSKAGPHAGRGNRGSQDTQGSAGEGPRAGQGRRN